MVSSFGSELKFLAAECCGSGGQHPEASACSVLEPLDWDLVRRLAARHRIEGLIWLRLAASRPASMPADILTDLERASRALPIRYLVQLRETLRLSELLFAAGYPAIVLKGCTVAHHLYRPHPELRHSLDIDLLVAPETFGEADRLLRREGYARTTPSDRLPASAESMVRHLLSAYEYEHAETGIKVELHHRLLADPHVMAIPFKELLAQSATVPIANRTVRGLSAQTLAVYLCAHGAGHRFFRLKWLADASRALDGLGRDRVIPALEQARSWNCERSVLLSMLLRDELGQRSPSSPPDWERKKLAPIAALARLAILREDRPGHGLVDVPDDLRDAVYGMRLATTWGSRGFAALRQLTHPDDALLLRLGANWAPLYALLGRGLALRRLATRYFERPVQDSGGGKP